MGPPTETVSLSVVTSSMPVVDDDDEDDDIDWRDLV